MNLKSNYHYAALRKIPKCNEQGIIISAYYPLCLGEDYKHQYSPEDYICMHKDWKFVCCEKCLTLKEK